MKPAKLATQHLVRLDYNWPVITLSQANRNACSGRSLMVDETVALSGRERVRTREGKPLRARADRAGTTVCGFR